MSVENYVDHWGASPSDPVATALAGIETALGELLAMDPAYWRTSQKEDVLARLESFKARQAALELRLLASAGDIAEETGDRDASAWVRANLLVDKSVAGAQIKLAAAVTKHELLAARLADGVVERLPDGTIRFTRRP